MEPRVGTRNWLHEQQHADDRVVSLCSRQFSKTPPTVYECRKLRGTLRGDVLTFPDIDLSGVHFLGDIELVSAFPFNHTEWVPVWKAISRVDVEFVCDDRDVQSSWHNLFGTSWSSCALEYAKMLSVGHWSSNCSTLDVVRVPLTFGRNLIPLHHIGGSSGKLRIAATVCDRDNVPVLFVELYRIDRAELALYARALVYVNVQVCEEEYEDVDSIVLPPQVCAFFCEDDRSDFSATIDVCDAHGRVERSQECDIVWSRMMMKKFFPLSHFIFPPFFYSLNSPEALANSGFQSLRDDGFVVLRFPRKVSCHVVMLRQHSGMFGEFGGHMFTSLPLPPAPVLRTEPAQPQA